MKQMNRNIIMEYQKTYNNDNNNKKNCFDKQQKKNHKLMIIKKKLYTIRLRDRERERVIKGFSCKKNWTYKQRIKKR